MRLVKFSAVTVPVLTFFPPLGRPLRILYAEDLPELRDFMRLFLTRAGHYIETFDDGSAALDRLGNAPGSFDLLITDHQMPRLTGLELVARLRQLPYPGKIAVFSSNLPPAAADGYQRLAVDLVLPKPVFPSTLLMMLEQLFQAGSTLVRPRPAAQASAKVPG
jgi:CheY-like chemotaxis protein